MRKKVECSDGTYFSANVGTFLPNTFGLYDTSGNAAEWVADCYHNNYANAPVDGSVWNTGCETMGVIRGGHFAMPGDPIKGVRSAAREAMPPLARSETVGFRVARTLK
jgi:formylglycine-generating enzyme required for sulfatase activity